MQKKTYCAPEMHTIAMLTEGMIAGSKEQINNIQINDEDRCSNEQSYKCYSSDMEEPTPTFWEK